MLLSSSAGGSIWAPWASSQSTTDSLRSLYSASVMSPTTNARSRLSSASASSCVKPVCVSTVGMAYTVLLCRRVVRPPFNVFLRGSLADIKSRYRSQGDKDELSRF